jgi:hypothetical protein
VQPNQMQQPLAETNQLQQPTQNKTQNQIVANNQKTIQQQNVLCENKINYN